MSMKALQRRHVQGMLDDRKAHPTNARDFLRTLRAVITYAISVEVRDDDPTVKITVEVPNTGGHHSWTEDEIAVYRAHYSIGTKERLALEILLGTALRCADVIKLGPQHIHNGVLVVPTTQKTKQPVTVPVSAELATAINAAAPTNALLFLVNEHGRQFPAGGFSRFALFGGPDLARQRIAPGERRFGASNRRTAALMPRYGFNNELVCPKGQCSAFISPP
jgi:integrase